MKSYNQKSQVYIHLHLHYILKYPMNLYPKYYKQNDTQFFLFHIFHT